MLYRLFFEVGTYESYAGLCWQVCFTRWRYFGLSLCWRCEVPGQLRKVHWSVLDSNLTLRTWGSLPFKMNRIHSAFGTFRTHWKKSTFGLAVAAYAGNYAKKKWDDNQMMKQYCHEALSYGEVNMSSLVPMYFKYMFWFHFLYTNPPGRVLR